MGLPVLAEGEDALEDLKDYGVQEIVFAITNIINTKKDGLFKLYKAAGYKVKVYDFSVADVARSGKRMLREFDIDELLFRQPIVVNNELVSSYYKDKVILVTGGGGSIGSEMCRQVAKMAPKQIIALDIYENGVYDLQQEADITKNIEIINFIRINYPEIKDFIEQYNNNREQLRIFTSYIESQKEEIRQVKENAVQEIKGDARDARDKTKDTVEKVASEFQSNTIHMQEETKKLHNQLKQYMGSLADDVQRELLAKYFEKERIKMKGNIDIKVIGIPFIIVLILKSVGSPEYMTFLRTILVYIGLFFLIQMGCNYFTLKESRQVNDNDSKGRFCNSVLKIIKQHTIEALFSPYWCWLAGTFLGMFSIMVIAVCIVLMSLFYWENVTYQRLLPFSPLCLVLIWVTWFCSKHFSYTKQVCDEYEYKYALSKSYLSYRQEAELLANRAGNDILLSDLMRAIIINIARSPVQSVKNDSNMPLSEILQTVKDITHDSSKKG